MNHDDYAPEEWDKYSMVGGAIMVDVTLWWIKIIEHTSSRNPNHRFEVLIKGKMVADRGRDFYLGFGKLPAEAYQNAVRSMLVKPFLVPDTLMKCPQCSGLGDANEDACPHAR